MRDTCSLRGEGVSRGSVRLIWPLLTETLRVELAHVAEPFWSGTRYWLTIDLDAKGCVADVSVRTDRNTTWDAEGSDDGCGSLFHDRLSETAYGAFEWVTSDFMRPEDFGDDADDAAIKEEP